MSLGSCRSDIRLRSSASQYHDCRFELARKIARLRSKASPRQDESAAEYSSGRFSQISSAFTHVSEETHRALFPPLPLRGQSARGTRRRYSSCRLFRRERASKRMTSAGGRKTVGKRAHALEKGAGGTRREEGVEVRSCVT